MNAIETIVKYATNALDTILTQESKTAILEGNPNFVNLDFTNGKTVKLMRLILDGLDNYGRANTAGEGDGYSNYNGVGHADGYKQGYASAKWDEYPLKYDRGIQFKIDEMDNEETAGLIIANVISETIRTQAVPEIDATRFAVLSEATNEFLGNRVIETLNGTKGDAHEITHSFNKAFEWLGEHGVTVENGVIFLSQANYTLLKNTEEIYKHLSQAEYSSGKGVSFAMEAYDGCPIVVVPSSRFLTGILLEHGWSPTADSKAINFIVCERSAVYPIVKLAKAKIFGPDVVQEFDGYKASFRIYHDLIVPTNKRVAVYASVSETKGTEKAGIVNVALKKTAAAATYKVDGVYTTPAGIYGTLIHKAGSGAAFVLGATDNSSNSIAVGKEFKATNEKEHFAIKDANNKIIAVGTVSGLATA